ncbi:35045_t:CDS:2 [Gigaspora margarita]|uniref:35045_t:CDS:1 n=1 Tax=Gigaspora margarita TaxID=4874 RepID=A0ABN7VP37_GIGMA|nr:35045_t:CDS:2 [Gigaspora margarita]
MSEIFMGICRVGKIDLKCEHQTDTYWDFGLHCPLCRESHMRVSFNEVLKAYPENSN